jgi:hypothetical protein
MSSRWSASSRSWAAVAAPPLIQARLLPAASMTAQQQGVVLEAGLVQPAAQVRRRVELGGISARGAFAHHARRPGRPAPAARRR